MSLFIFYLLIINIIGLYAMYDDKHRAINKSWRISESNLFIISIIGGSIGVFCGMKAFKHKTKHNNFIIGIPSIILFQAMILVFLKS